MSSLRDIRRRIKSIQNTQKITQAMRMVAAAKVKKAEAKVKASRPFSNELVKAFFRLLNAKPEISSQAIQPKRALDNYSALLKQRELKTVGILLVTSDRGLAGGYNANLIRKAIARFRMLKAQNINVKFFIVGLKGVNAFKKASIDIAETYIKMPVMPNVNEAHIIAEDLAEYFTSEKIDKIEIITTKFKSMLSFEVQQWDVLPVKIKAEKSESEKKVPAEMIFNPNPEEILQIMVPLYISNRVYQALLEASASELAARMSAMSAASSNAADVIQMLTIDYNKARQAAITQELLEVVTGANALTSS